MPAGAAGIAAAAQSPLAEGGCVANYGHPWESDDPKNGCSECSRDNSTCIKCWALFGLSRETGKCMEVSGLLGTACQASRELQTA